ncbi:MAG TPA: hypothetical protein VEX86_25055 [Longimicrobium sp.]|nr:hypothetical protein [Longimicrobium sp.]
MTIKEVEAAALTLSEREREELIQHLLASLRRRKRPIEEDPIFGLGSSPVECDVTDGSAEHDRYLYGSPHD